MVNVFYLMCKWARELHNQWKFDLKLANYRGPEKKTKNNLNDIN